MKLIEPSFEIIAAPTYHDMLATVERAARVCHQSEPTDKGPEAFIKRIIILGHHSVLEHCSISVRIICDRGVSHEMVRHRLASYSQESQRYCAYRDEVEFIKPHWFGNKSATFKHEFLDALQYAECAYDALLREGIGLSPQDARSVLPNATKTEIVMTANLREWRHIFSLRCSRAAHPEIRRIMIPMRAEFANRWPVFFEDLLQEEV
jgi:thymidylate synthase (FAD)